MSIELYPDHKAILHFHDSLKVYEVDFLDYLTDFLAQEAYADRHFDIYVKPTIHYSVFDFIIVEPNQKIYTMQTPESTAEYLEQKEATNDFFEQHLSELSPTLSRNIQQSAQANETIQKALIKQLFYIFEEDLFDELHEIKFEEDVFLSASDFADQTERLERFFVLEKNASNRLTPTESREIKATLNPNTNINPYIPKTVPKDYQENAESRSQSKQKFKGPKGAGKTILLAKRVINSSNRLKNNGNILVVSGDANKTRLLKDIITGEAGKSLQELGIDVSSYDELMQPKQKYHALFIDDGQCLPTAAYHDLLENFLVEMTEDTDYEYVVMADDKALPKVPQIFGPFITLKFDLGKMSKLLNQSRAIFLSIINE